MTPSQVQSFLAALGATNVQPRGGWVSASCPLAPWTHDSGTDSNPSFAISCKPGKESIFNCYACEHGDLLHLVQLLKKYGAKKPRYDLRRALEVLAEDDGDITLAIKDYDQTWKEDKEEIIPWSESWLSTFMPAWKVPLAMEYLNGRSVSGKLAELYDIRWDGGRECVSFPVRDFEGRLCGLRGRRLGGGYYDYGGPLGHRNKQVWLGEERVDLSRTVVFVESVFDAVSVARVYGNVAAPLTVGMSKAKVRRMESALDIVTLFDNGKGGDKARKLVDKYLPSSLRVHLLPPKHCSDPGDMTVEELHKVLNGRVNLGLA